MGKKKNAFIDTLVVFLGGSIVASLGAVGVVLALVFGLTIATFMTSVLIGLLNFALAKAFAIPMLSISRIIWSGLAITVFRRLVFSMRRPRV